jgi:hypothetical protein
MNMKRHKHASGEQPFSTILSFSLRVSFSFFVSVGEKSTGG